MIAAALLALVLAQVQPARSFNPLGRWRAQIEFGTTSAFENVRRSVSFDIEISKAGESLKASLINGNARMPFSSAVWSGDRLVLELAQFDARIVAEAKEAGFTGTFTHGPEKLRFSASRAPPATGPPRAEKPSRVAGSWAVEVYFPNRTEEMTNVAALLRAEGSALAGTILSSDGDWGPLSGTIEGDHVVLQSFSGALLYRFDGNLHEDGSMSGDLLMSYVETLPGDERRRTGAHPWKARRLRDTDDRAWTQTGFTSLRAVPRKGDEAFGVWRAETPEGRFLDDRTSDTFAHKAHVLFFMQAHALSAHEELLVLRDLYARYHPRGLEFGAVALLPRRDRESPKVARAEAIRFFDSYRTGFPLLIGLDHHYPREYAGPQHPPRTFFFDRSHSLVRTLVGFEGHATGSRHLAMVREMEATMELILK